MNKFVVVAVVVGVGVFLYRHNTLSSGAAVTNHISAAAVGLASGTFHDGNDVTPVDNKKYPRSKCPFCKGKGYIEQGDGHRTECTHCYIEDEMESKGFPKCGPGCACGDNCVCKDKECLAKCSPGCVCGPRCDCVNNECLKKETKKCSPDCKCTPTCECKDHECLKDNFAGCCQDCICNGKCNCTYRGECLVKKNGGKPVTICDGNVCRRYYPPSFKADMVKEFNKDRISVAQDVLAKAAKLYAEKNFTEAANEVEAANKILSADSFGEDSANADELAAIQRKIQAAYKNLEKQGVNLKGIIILSRPVYEKFLIDYHNFKVDYKKYQEANEAIVARLNKYEGQSVATSDGGSCSGGSCSSGGCSSGSCGSGGGGCSSGSCGGGGGGCRGGRCR